MVNWVLVLTYGAGMAGVALIGAEYLNPLLPPSLQGTQSTWLTAILTLLALYTINMLGIRAGSRTQNLLSSLKLLMMGALCIGIFMVKGEAVTASEASTLPEGNWLAAFGAGLIAVFYTYGGYQQTLNFGADIKDPVRTTPKGIFLGIALILFIYLAINYAYYRVLGFEGIRNSPLLAADTAQALFGDTGKVVFSIAIYVSVVGFINATMLSVPRVYYAMADDHLLPALFKKINPRTQVQEFALSFLLLSTLGSLWFLDTFEQIVNYVMSIDSVAIASAAATIFVFRKRAGKPDPHRGYRLPAYPWLAIFFVGFLLVVALNVILTDFSSALVGWGLFLAGAPLYWVLKRVL
jgi:APA family basic amino acid/polyamine antiporter